MSEQKTRFTTQMLTQPGLEEAAPSKLEQRVQQLEADLAALRLSVTTQSKIIDNLMAMQRTMIENLTLNNRNILDSAALSGTRVEVVPFRGLTKSSSN